MIGWLLYLACGTTFSLWVRAFYYHHGGDQEILWWQLATIGVIWPAVFLGVLCSFIKTFTQILYKHLTAHDQKS